MAMYQPRPKSMTECPGPGCPGCGSAECMKDGGQIKGVHTDSTDPKGNTSDVGSMNMTQGYNKDPENKKMWGKAMKLEHGKVLGELRDMKGADRSGMGYADGGQIKGVHDPISKWQIREPKSESGKGGVSVAGENLRSGDEDRMRNAKFEHKKNLMDLQTMKKPNLMAEGGEVEDPEHAEEMDDEGDEELRHAMGSELMDALDRKDKKGIMDALEAAVLSIKGRHQ